jgi:predicted dehydrogenase
MSESIAPVSWGVISTADIGMRKVIPAMQQGTLSRVDAIASRDPATASSAAAEVGIPRSFGSYEELLDDPEIEAVYIPLPNHMHLEWAVASARAGKHVLCEKPLAMTAAEAEEIVSVCADSGVLLMEAFMYRLHSMWQKVLELIGDGSIGEVRAVNSVFSYFNDDPTNIRNIPEVGGGALYDIGCYAVNVSRTVFGREPVSVEARILRDPALGTDILTSAVLDFEDGHGTFLCSTQMESDQRVVILGTTGRIVVDIPFNIPGDRPSVVHLISGGDPPVAPNVETHETPAANPYTVQGDIFSRSIRTGEPLPFPAEDAVGNMRVIEQIFAAAND